MPWPVNPSAQTDGAFTFCTPHSAASGALGLLGATLNFASSGGSIQFAALFESIRATSSRAASDSINARSAVATIMFAAQKD